MSGAGRDARRNGTEPINRKTHNNDPEAGSDRRSHGSLRFLRDGATLSTA
jgi:hypothetical protein